MPDTMIQNVAGQCNAVCLPALLLLLPVSLLLLLLLVAVQSCSASCATRLTRARRR
jgi:hypothetical protein